MSTTLIKEYENEPRILAEKLQSNIACGLNGIKAILEIAHQLPHESLLTTCKGIEAQVDSLLDQINRLSLDLWPTMLNHLDLVSSLQIQLQQFTNETQIQVDFQHSCLSYTFKPHTKFSAFRILQEVLSSIADSLSVNAVTLQMWVEDNNLVIKVGDFDLETSLVRDSTFEIMSVQERINMLGGESRIISSSENGTHLIIRLSISVISELEDEDKLSIHTSPILTQKDANVQKDNQQVEVNILTSRESQVLQLVVEGYTSTEIADELSISPRTAETHRANMMRRIGVRNQAELITYALQHNLVSVDQLRMGA